MDTTINPAMLVGLSQIGQAIEIEVVWGNEGLQR